MGGQRGDLGVHSNRKEVPTAPEAGGIKDKRAATMTSAHRVDTATVGVQPEAEEEAETRGTPTRSFPPSTSKPETSQKPTEGGAKPRTSQQGSDSGPRPLQVRTGPGTSRPRLTQSRVCTWDETPRGWGSTGPVAAVTGHTSLADGSGGQKAIGSPGLGALAALPAAPQGRTFSCLFWLLELYSL